VTRSISGHATEAMQRHYSTVALEEQRNGLSDVIRLIHPGTPTVGSGEDGGEGASSSGEDRDGSSDRRPPKQPELLT
jgi:hypothetical protein